MLKNKHTLSRPASATFPLGANISVLSGPKLELQPPMLLHCYLDNLLNTLEPQQEVAVDKGRSTALTTRTVDGTTITEYTFTQLQHLATKVAQGFNELLSPPNTGGVRPAMDVQTQNDVRTFSSARIGTTSSATRRHPTERDDVPFIVFCARKSPQLCMAILGALKAGCAYVPVDYDWPEERLRYILNDARPSVVVYDDACKYVAVLQQYCKDQQISEPIMIDNLFENNGSNSDVVHYSAQTTTCEHHTAVVLYTSGTTGQPKGCKLPHRGLMNALQFRLQHFPYYPDEEGLLKTVMTFSDSVLEMFETWFNLRPLVIVTKQHLLDVTWFLRFLENNNRIYRMIVVPSLLTAMLDILDGERRTFSGGLRMMMTGGEPLTIELVEDFFEKFPQTTLANFYGQTECCADLTYEIWDNLEAFRDKLSSTGLISIGRPIDNLTVYILDANLKPASVGQVDELFVSGPSVCNSYIGSATLGKFLPNHLIEDCQQQQQQQQISGHSVLLKSGDLAVYNADVIYLVGRSDDMVKIAGQKVHLAEVLRAMQTLPNVAECTVLSLVRTGEIKIIGFVRFSSASSPSAADREDVLLHASRAALGRKLPRYAVPRLIPYRDKLPRTVSGKIAKQSLVDYYCENYENLSQNSLSTPRGLLATAIGVVEADIDVERSFVENGGSSLKILPAVLALQKVGFQIELQQFLTANTVRDIIDVCEQLQKSSLNSSSENGDNKFQQKISPPRTVPTCSFKVIMKPICDLDKHEVINVVAESFGTYSDLAIFGESNAEDERAEYEQQYAYFLADGISFGLVRESDNRVVAVSWSTDFETQIPLFGSTTTYGRHVYELIEFVDKAMVPYLPRGKGKVWHGWMAGILPSVGVNDKVALMYMLVDLEIKKAKQLGFQCIAAETASPLVEQLVHGFVRHEAYVKIRPRDFVASDGRMPWSNYPEDYYLYGDVMWLNGRTVNTDEGDDIN